MSIIVLLMVALPVIWIGWRVVQSIVNNQAEDEEYTMLIWLSPKIFFAHLCIYLLIYTPLVAGFRNRVFLFWLPILLLHAVVSLVYAVFLRKQEAERKERSEYDAYYENEPLEPEIIQLADGTTLEIIDEG